MQKMIKASTSRQSRSRTRGRPRGISGERGPARERSRSRARRAILLGLLAAIAMVECATGAMTTPWLFVRSVSVRGAGSLPDQEAEKALAHARIPERTGILRAPVRGLEQNLSTLPFLAHARVSRSWPDGLTVHLTPREPFAVLLAAGRHWEVDRGGTVIRRGRPTPRLPLIQIPAGSAATPGHRVADEAFADALKIARKLPRMNLPHAAKIVVDPQAHICLNMSGEVLIRLGRAEELDEKLALLEKIYRDRPDVASEISTIDLTAPEHPACVRRSDAELRKQAETNAKGIAGAEGSGQFTRSD